MCSQTAAFDAHFKFCLLVLNMHELNCCKINTIQYMLLVENCLKGLVPSRRWTFYLVYFLCSYPNIIRSITEDSLYIYISLLQRMISQQRLPTTMIHIRQARASSSTVWWPERAPRMLSLSGTTMTPSWPRVVDATWCPATACWPSRRHRRRTVGTTHVLWPERTVNLSSWTHN